jgi:hypothetical protein
MRIRRVTDLRTGLPHPRRDSHGRFISRKNGAHMARVWDNTLREHEQGRVLFFTWPVWVFHLCSMRLW